jgi:ring-1,2-phenylacetyl-CoA epoxidase subunit PaaC
MADNSQNLRQAYILRLADNALIIGQRLSEWCGHAPALEEDIATANTALDLIGQARNWFDYASSLDAEGRSEDQLALLRDENQYTNVLLVEQPNGDYANTLMRQFIFDAWHYHLLEQLKDSKDETVAGIAQKSVKEVTYHLSRSSDLIMRLGYGTQKSHEMLQEALNNLWRFSGELTMADELDTKMFELGIGADLSAVADKFSETVESVFKNAMLEAPKVGYMQRGGKAGVHSESMGRLLAEMQVLQRTYPDMVW